MLYVCLKCGRWMAPTPMNLTETLIESMLASNKTVRIQRMCPECNKEMHKVEASEKVHVIQSLQIDAEDSNPIPLDS